MSNLTPSEIITNLREVETGFTPGPWTVPHFARPEVGCQCGYVLCEQHFGAVATVHASGDDSVEGGDNPLFEQACANAHLIAAAPDLYASVKDLLDIFEEYAEDWDEDSVGLHIVADAKAALAKATASTAPANKASDLATNLPSPEGKESGKENSGEVK